VERGVFLFVSELKKKDLQLVYEMGFKWWGVIEGKTWEEYVKECQKEDERGTRLALYSKEGNILATSSSLNFKLDTGLEVVGIGSLLANSLETKNSHGLVGYGLSLVNLYGLSLRKENKNVILMGYADINPNIYKRLGYRALPCNLQRYRGKSCMVCCSDDNYEILSSLDINQIPSYF
jgi:hypothetical protein